MASRKKKRGKGSSRPLAPRSKPKKAQPKVYEIKYRPGAARDFRGLPRSVQKQIKDEVDQLAKEPRPQGIDYLGKGEDGDSIYRLRSGDYRIVYEVQDGKLVVRILMIGDRRDIYERLQRLR